MVYGAANVTYSFAQGGLHHVGPFLWTTSDIEVIFSALAVAGLIYLLLQRTRFGKAVRAVSQDRALAQVSGIPARRIVMQTWALAGAVSGFAGFVLADTIGTFGPTLGFSFLLLTITATRRRRHRPAVRDPRRRPARRAGDPDRRHLHQFGLPAGLRVPAPGAPHAVPAERRLRPAQRDGGACLMYWVSVFTEAGIFAILALGLDVVWGWSGDFDLAFYGYLALGSYMTFVLAIGRPTPPVEYIIGWHLPVLLAMRAGRRRRRRPRRRHRRHRAAEPARDLLRRDHARRGERAVPDRRELHAAVRRLQRRLRADQPGADRAEPDL